MTDFINKLAAIQKKYRLNYSQLGQYLGLGPHIVSKYISGERVPSLQTVRLLNVLLDLEECDKIKHDKYLPECDFHYRKASKICPK